MEARPKVSLCLGNHRPFPNQQVSEGAAEGVGEGEEGGVAGGLGAGLDAGEGDAADAGGCGQAVLSEAGVFSQAADAGAEGLAASTC